jgi:WD40 repeat protein
MVLLKFSCNLFLTLWLCFSITTSYSQIVSQNDSRNEKISQIEFKYDQYNHLFDLNNTQQLIVTKNKNSTCFNVNENIFRFIGANESLKIIQQIISNLEVFVKSKKSPKNSYSSLKSWVDFLGAKIKNGFLIRNVQSVGGLDNFKLFDRFNTDAQINSHDNHKVLLIGETEDIFNSKVVHKGPCFGIVENHGFSPPQVIAIDEDRTFSNGHEKWQKDFLKSADIKLGGFFGLQNHFLIDLTSGNRAHILQIWQNGPNGADLINTFRGSKNFISFYSLAKNGKYLAVTEIDSEDSEDSESKKSPSLKIQIYNPITKKLIATFKPQNKIIKMYFTPNGNHLTILNENNKIEIWEIYNDENPILIKTLDLLDLPFLKLNNESSQNHFSPSSDYLMHIAYLHPGELWHIPSGRRVGLLKPRLNRNCGNQAYTPYEYYSQIHFAQFPQELDDDMISNLERDQYQKLKQKYDKYFLAGTFPSSQLDLYETKSLTLIKSFNTGTALMSSFRFSPDLMNFSTTGLDGTLKFWNIESGEEILRIQSPHNYFLNGFFAPDSSSFTSYHHGSTNGKKEVHKNGEFIREIPYIFAVNFWEIKYYGDKLSDSEIKDRECNKKKKEESKCVLQ